MKKSFMIEDYESGFYLANLLLLRFQDGRSTRILLYTAMY